jgi:F0F1-type ATP synthase membrane subunit b/b'
MNLESLAQYSQWVGALIFLIVIVWLFRKFLAPGVAAYETSRNAEIAESEARRQHLKSDVSAARAGIEAADRDAAAILARAKDFATHEHERIIAEAQSDAQHVVRNGEGELGRARIAARGRLRDELVKLALQAARTQAAARVDGALNSQLVSGTVDFLAAGRG